jgi:hypothetical protein
MNELYPLGYTKARGISKPPEGHERIVDKEERLSDNPLQ